MASTSPTGHAERNEDKDITHNDQDFGLSNSATASAPRSSSSFLDTNNNNTNTFPPRTTQHTTQHTSRSLSLSSLLPPLPSSYDFSPPPSSLLLNTQPSSAASISSCVRRL